MTSTRAHFRLARAYAAAALMAVCVPGSQVALAQDNHNNLPIAGTASEIERFCANIADEARDQRYVLQRAELQKLQADIDLRMEQLQAKTEEYQDWLRRRNEFLDKAELGLVDIFKTMKADAAAAQLELVDVNISAAIIMKLSPRQSSLVLSEMKPDIAARITGIISNATDPTTSRDPS